MTNYSAAGYGSNIFAGGVFDGQNIWLVPYRSGKLVKVNPATGAMTDYPAEYTEGVGAFMGGVFDGQNIWLVPYNSTNLVKVNPATGARTNYSFEADGYSSGSGFFAGGVFDGQNIWLVPFNSNYLVKVHPQEFGNEILFTGGNATIGGSLLVSGTIGVAGRLNINSSYNQTFNCIGNDSAMDDGLSSSKDLFIEDNVSYRRFCSLC
jgi:hypothetical protein